MVELLIIGVRNIYNEIILFIFLNSKNDFRIVEILFILDVNGVIRDLFFSNVVLDNVILIISELVVVIESNLVIMEGLFFIMINLNFGFDLVFLNIKILLLLLKFR